MKRSFFVLITFLFSFSLLAQVAEMDEIAQKDPSYSDRIRKTKEFLNSIKLTDQGSEYAQVSYNLTKTKDFTTTNGASGKAYLYKNKRVVVILQAKTAEEGISLSTADLPDQMKVFVNLEQDRGSLLTEVLNLENQLGEDGRMIQTLPLDSKNEAQVHFKGPLAILVTLTPAHQLELENVFFNSVSIEYMARIMEEKEYKDAYNDMIDKRDFRYALLKYSKTADKYASDLEIVRNIMTVIDIELGSQFRRLESESVRLLSNPRTVSMIEGVVGQDPELAVFSNYVNYWYKTFAMFALDEIINPEKGKYGAFPKEIREHEQKFNVVFKQKIRAYMLSMKGGKGIIGK